MTTPKLKAFLSIKSPVGLAIVLYGRPYSELQKLIYPSPRYREFTIKKKNGNDRLIAQPSPLLIDAQRELASILNLVVQARPSAHGFVQGKSIVTNARSHVGPRKSFIFNIDLKDFFPSITFKRVRGLFMAQPFSFPFSVATTLAQICCWKGVLPQGAPTSPVISNLICRGLDGDLQKLAEECRSTYTRYADDITFSFTTKTSADLPERIVRLAGGAYSVGESLREAIEKHSFKINLDKVRLHSKHGRLEVTGLSVNKFPNVRREFVHQIRGMLNAWEKYGLAKATAVFGTKATHWGRQYRTGNLPRFERVLWGKLLFLKMVKTENDPVYLRLARRYNSLATTAHLGETLPAPDVVIDERDLTSSTFVLQCEDANANFSQGTGFYLSGIGVVTCEHVIRHPESDIATRSYKYFTDGPKGQISLQTADGKHVCCLNIVYVNRYADLAILSPAETESISVLSFLQSPTPAEVGDTVSLVGFPDHRPSKSLAHMKGGVVTPVKKNAYAHFEIEQLIRVGNSGGPVLNADLSVIGMAKEGVKQEGGGNNVLSIQEIISNFSSGIKSVADS